MLHITRAEVLSFLEEYSIPYVEDSSNSGDDFLRNRLRHSVMPLLKQENPSLALNLSAMAQRLRKDEQTLSAEADRQHTNNVQTLREMAPAIRSRVLGNILLQAGVKEPEGEHIGAMEKLVFSANPSAKVSFPGGVVMTRNYNTLTVLGQTESFAEQELTCPGVYHLPGIQLTVSQNQSRERTITSFAFTPKGKLLLRSRKAGDTIRLLCGTKTLKKLFIDEKIPAAKRDTVPVLADDEGVLAVIGIGGNLDRLSDDGTVRLQIENP
jgi:tRNA(Ile)-lysidine synthase